MKTRRLVGAAALATVVAAGLSGCVKMDMHLDLQSDDTVDGTMVFAVSSAMAELVGQDPATIAEELSGDTFDMDEDTIVNQEPYDDGEFVGTRVTFEGETLESFSGEGEDQLSIVREGDEYVVSGRLDLSDETMGTDGGDPMVASLLEGFTIQIAVTFPGKVASHNGDLEGTTVTWVPQYGEVTEISARGSAVDGGSGLPLPLLIGIGAAVLLAIALIAVLVVRSRKNAAAPVAGPEAYTAGYAPAPQQGFAPPAAAPAPPVPPVPPVADVAPPAPPVQAAPPAPPVEAAPSAPPAPPASDEQTPPPPPA